MTGSPSLDGTADGELDAAVAGLEPVRTITSVLRVEGA